MYNMTQKVQLCLFTISQKHKWSLKTPQHQQLIFKIKREKVFEYKIRISFPLQEIYHFPQILWYKGTSRKLRSSSEAGILEKNPHVKGLSHGTLAVFISKLHNYNSLLPLLTGNILLWTWEEDLGYIFMERSL